MLWAREIVRIHRHSDKATEHLHDRRDGIAYRHGLRIRMGLD